MVIRVSFALPPSRILVAACPWTQLEASIPCSLALDVGQPVSDVPVELALRGIPEQRLGWSGA